MRFFLLFAYSLWELLRRERLPHESRQDDTLYRILYRNTVVQPDRVFKQCGNVTFVIPCPHEGKSLKLYNYLGYLATASSRTQNNRDKPIDNCFKIT